MTNHSASAYKVISLFSGCGGGDLGICGGFDFLGKWYKRLPFEITSANDVDRFATQVYSHNLGLDIHTGDITRVKFERLATEPQEVDVLLAGFPCQDFSLTGPRKGLESRRGQLYKEIRRALRYYRPKLFLAENVPGIEYPPAVLATIKRGLAGRTAPKYRIRVYRVNAADYGVPQIRHRVLLIGIRSDLLSGFRAPKTTHISPDSPNGKLPHWATAKETLDDLWDIAGPNSSKVADQGKLTHATIILGRPKRRDRILNPDCPAPTIRAQHHGHVEVHYRALADGTPRRLTIRECARLQGFPDSFTFPVSASRAYVQIGNAMPPMMMHHWGRSIAAWLRKLQERAKLTAANRQLSGGQERKQRDQAVTSRIMSAVKGRGSKAERALAASMWNLGMRYRKHPKGVAGKPDFAFLGAKLAVFCDGDFWHGKGWEKRRFRSWDEQFDGLHNAEFWRSKIARNMARDREVAATLCREGWVVLRYLESDILQDPMACAIAVQDIIVQRKGPSRKKVAIP